MSQGAPPVSTTPVANFATSSTCVVYTAGKFATGVNDTGGKFAAGFNDANCRRFRHRWQIMGTISGCRHLRVNLRQKFIHMLTLLPKGAQTKLLKFFCLKIFSICLRSRWHRWCTLSREYLRKFSKKFEMAVMMYSDAWGKLIHEKNQKLKISWHCPFKLYTRGRCIRVLSVAHQNINFTGV